jgi:hypothetical protein
MKSTCCVKIQNDCSESFETRQGLRQGDVLSTLLFDVVLEATSKPTNNRHNLQQRNTTKLAYADDIDIAQSCSAAVGRGC